MRRIIYRILLSTSLIVGNGYANALPDDPDNEMTSYVNYDTYIGVNYKQNWIRAKKGWHHLFVDNKPGFDVYFGWRFHPNFGAELGYEWTDHKPKSYLIPINGSLLGVVNTSDKPITLIGSVRLRTLHFDVNAFIPLTEDDCENDFNPELIISLGVTSMDPNISIYSNPNPDPDPTAGPFYTEFLGIAGRTRAVFRAGLGIQTVLIEDVGIRLLWRYEGTSALRARGSSLVGTHKTHNLFRNCNSIAVGLYKNFY